MPLKNGTHQFVRYRTPAPILSGNGGCHLNRPIETLLTGAGFEIDRLQTGYMQGPKLMTFMYEGAARPH